ncbi:MAG: TonB-dependent receptor [Marinagarivorans sp.]|nr:TonB-dependent receptor [Marinagarivorans sp.]
MLSDKLALTAGLRAERYEQSRLDKRRSAEQGNEMDTSNTEILPGLGLTYQLNPALQVFGSV